MLGRFPVPLALALRRRAKVVGWGVCRGLRAFCSGRGL